MRTQTPVKPPRGKEYLGRHIWQDLAWKQHFDNALPHTPTLRVDQIAKAAGVNERTVSRAFKGGGS